LNPQSHVQEGGSRGKYRNVICRTRLSWVGYFDLTLLELSARPRRPSSGWNPADSKSFMVLPDGKYRSSQNPLASVGGPPMTIRARAGGAAVFVLLGWLAGLLASPASAADEPDLIFKRSTVFKWLTPDDKLATYGIDDPEVDGVSCHFTVPEKGGLKGWIGVAEEVSDISLSCRQVGPIRFKKKFEQGEDVFRARRSLFFKKMQIVRGCDTKRNVLVYMVYSDKLIEGSPKNSTSSVPVMPWGAGDQAQKCADWVG
jgi:CreA protein